MKWWPFAKTRPDVKPGQESQPEDTINGVIGRIAGFYNFSAAPFDLRALEVLEKLGMFNPDVSQALSIWVNLGNTGHEVTTEARNPQAVLDRLNYLAATCNPVGGGIDGLVNHWLRQIPLMGALSSEWVVADRIQDGLVDCVTVPVKRIRWQRVDGQWRPFQLTNAVAGGNMGYIALNPVTYSCMPLQTNDGNPYPIPLFLSALKNIDVQLQATGGLSSILRKMGLLGFLDVSLDVPEKKAGESDESYAIRLAVRLKTYAAAYSANLSKGVAVHYKDQEIKHNSVAPGAAAGAKQIFDLNEEQVFSGLDIPPSMAGRSYSTTETYATQDYERTIAKIGNGRRIIKRFLEKGYTLDLLLRGIDAPVSVTFNQNAAFKEKEQAEAEGERIKNVLSKRDGWIIDDDQAARELGYEKATGNRPAPEGIFGGTVFAFNRKLGRYEHKPEVIEVRSLEQPADDRRDQSYQAALEAVLADPEEAAIKAALAAAEKEYFSAAAFAKGVYSAFRSTLQSEIKKTAVMRICTRFTGDEWKRWRYENKNHLAADIRPLPAPKWSRDIGRFAGDGIDIGVVDRNAIRYITNVEQFYFGQGNYLAKHPKQGNKLISWLQNEYIDKGLNIRDEATWTEFRDNFKGLVRVTSFEKIEQIVSTTMGRIQNMGQTMSLYEAGVERYQIVGPKTAPICDHCKAMLGRTFEVAVAAKRLSKILEKGVEKDENGDLLFPPFLTSKYRAEDLDKEKMTDEELQAAGFETPPYHPRCRHRKAAVD